MLFFSKKWGIKGKNQDLNDAQFSKYDTTHLSFIGYEILTNGENLYGFCI